MHAQAAVRRAREGSIGVKDAKLFNLLPDWMMTMNGVTFERFRGELDKFQMNLQDLVEVELLEAIA